MSQVKDLPPEGLRPKEVSRDLATVVVKCLSKEPGDSHRTCPAIRTLCGQQQLDGRMEPLVCVGQNPDRNRGGNNGRETYGFKKILSKLPMTKNRGSLQYC